MLSRCTPCQLTSLDRCQIVKVIAGGLHSVALSAACQVASANMICMLCIFSELFQLIMCS